MSRDALNIKVAMAVPGTGPCGISDYAQKLQAHYPGMMTLFTAPVFEARGFDLLHVQYEPTLFRKERKTLFPDLMRGNRRIKRVVTVHEVYEKNPFIAPRPETPGLLGALSRARYDFSHSLELSEEGFARKGFFADRVVVHTRHAKAILTRKGCPAEKIEVIPFPVYRHPPARGTPLGWKKIPQEMKVVLMFGFISPVVDFETVLKAMHAHKERCVLVLAGCGRRREDKPLEDALEALVSKEGLTDCVRRTGYVPEECLDFLFNRADVFVSAPRFKSSSASLAHALGSGLPIVAPDLPHVQEINAEANCIRTFRPGDPVDLAEKINTLLEAETHQDVKERILNYAGNHSMEKFAADNASVYRRAIEDRH